MESVYTFYLCIMTKKRIAIFASGTGSNALNLIRYFADHDSIEVGVVLTNNASAPIIESAQKEGVHVVVRSNEWVASGASLIEICQKHQVDWVILAGYLRLIPSSFLNEYHNRVINLHPSLLPKYGGKGMYGRKVHEAVLANHESVSGITIHYVNERFDEGRIIAQFTCEIEPNETVESLEKKIRELEHSYLPVVVYHTLNNSH